MEGTQTLPISPFVVSCKLPVPGTAKEKLMIWSERIDLGKWLQRLE
jgi:hypothetical protein